MLRVQGSGLRAQLKLEQRLLRSKDGSGLWKAPDSAVIIVVSIELYDRYSDENS